MRNKLTFLIILFILCFNSAFGQTASEIEAKYGKPANAYSVSERIWMTPEFAADGQICRMRLYPKRVSGNINYLSKELPFDDFRFVVDQIVPISQRGAKKQPFYGGAWATGGGAMWTIFTYEKVTIMYSAGFEVTSWENYDSLVDSKPFVFSEQVASLPNEKSKGTEKPEDDFEGYRTSKAEIVTISWNGRKCGVN